MKKIFVPVCIMLISTAAFSQYKKASFFSKSGRVYELGGATHLFSDHDGPNPLSVFYSNSIENEKNGGFLFELEYIMKSRLKYAGTYINSNYQQVQGDIYGNRGSTLAVKYGYQYRFVNKQNEDSKLEPYVKGLFFYGYRFGSNNVTDKNGNDIQDPNPFPASRGSAYGLEAGAGVTYYFSEKFGIRAGGLYQYAFAKKTDDYGMGGTYEFYKPHPGFSISFKYRILSE